MTRHQMVTVIFLFIGGVYCATEEILIFNNQQDELGISNQEKWRAVEPYRNDNERWIPANDPVQPTEVPLEDEPIKRRRPGRKRKRRPPTLLEDESYPDRLPVRSRTRRPQRLEQWEDDILAEEPFRSARAQSRRRLYPKYDEIETQKEKINWRPYTIHEPDKMKSSEEVVHVTGRTDVTTSTSLDLKSLLKQSGDISLSELLQQRNLSLADLLKGEQQAISALTGIQDITTNQPLIEEHKPSRRISTIRASTTQQSQTIPTLKDKLYTNSVQDTTEKRIFVPSHPKYYTSVDYKPKTSEIQAAERDIVISSTITFSTSETPIIVTTKKMKTTDKTLPPTLAKLKSLAAKTTMKSVINSSTMKISPVPPKAFKINVNELFGVPKIFTIDTKSKSNEGPMKINVNVEEMIKNSQQQEAKRTESLNHTSENVKQFNPKDEIIEILSDSVSRENLSRLLHSRNMTLQELLEQRERGSSQRHLADIFHNQTKEPEPDEIIVDHVNSPLPVLFDTFPVFKQNIKTRESRQFPLKDVNSKLTDNLHKLNPILRQAYTNNIDNLLSTDEAHRIEEIENKLAEAVNEALNVNVIQPHKIYNNPTEENEFLLLPYGVRSAIIASAVIIGISFLIFITIFIVFKWTQRERKRMTYNNSFSKSPILETPYQRRIFESIINATLGRKKKIATISCANNSKTKNLHEYLWNNDRKPFQ